MLSRSEAVELVLSQKPEFHMVKHGEASEAVMCVLAKHFNEDVPIWGLAGLLHDLDYPVTKNNGEKHGITACEMLEGKVPQEVLTAIAAHNSEYTGVEPTTRMDFALRAAETVTGLVSAAALMRPTGMEGMQAKSLKKKMKDKAFAAAVSRERIKDCERIDLSLDDFLTLAIEAMTPLHTTAK